MINPDLLKGDLAYALGVVAESGRPTDAFREGYDQALDDFFGEVTRLGICHECSAVWPPSHDRSNENNTMGLFIESSRVLMDQP
jgi:hypothetical protein